MNALIPKLVRSLSKIPEYAQYVPEWSKPVLRPFSGIYYHIYRLVYSSIKEEKLVKTPMGPYIYVDYSDFVEREVANGTYEREYMEMFCKSILEGNVVIDVGAYIGIFSLLASERVGDTGCVHSFEPVPRNHERLLRNIKINQAKNIRVYKKGLFDEKEILPISIPENNPAESTLYEYCMSEVSSLSKINKEVIEVELVPFDELAGAEGIQKVDIIKIDVEGAEYRVIRGMERTLKSNNPVLFMEYNPTLIEQVGEHCVEMIPLLINCGFKTIYSIKCRKIFDLDQDITTVIEYITECKPRFILSKNIGEIQRLCLP